MNARKMQLPLNSFGGYGVLETGVHLEGYLRQCSLRFMATILFNARLFQVVNFEFRPLFCFAEDTFPSFV